MLSWRLRPWQVLSFRLFVIQNQESRQRASPGPLQESRQRASRPGGGGDQALSRSPGREPPDLEVCSGVVHHWWIAVQNHLICCSAETVPPKSRRCAREAQMTAAICSRKQGIMTSLNKDLCCSLRNPPAPLTSSPQLPEAPPQTRCY